MGRPKIFRADNGGEFTSRLYVNFCDSAGFRCEYAGPGKPHQSAEVKSAIWPAVKGGDAARREVGRLLPGVNLSTTPYIGPNGDRLWLEAVLWTADCFNRSATKTDTACHLSRSSRFSA